MFARYYNSATGRFLSPDWSVKHEPVPYAKLDRPQSLNLYSYVLNSPLGKTDIDGHGPPDEDIEIDPKTGAVEDPLEDIVRNYNELKEAEAREQAGRIQHGQETLDVHEMMNGPSATQGRGLSPLSRIEQQEMTPPDALYKRPNNATTPQQRASVQGMPCATCGAVGQKNNADHIDPLVEQHYRGGIDKDRMTSTEAVRPQCSHCSAQQGGLLSGFSKAMKKLAGSDK